MGWVRASALAAVIWVSMGAFAEGEQCKLTFKVSLQSKNKYEQAIQVQPQGEAIRYPKGARGSAGRTLQFGFESEYTLDSYASKLLDLYRPEAVSEAQWNSMRPKAEGEPDQRVKWIKDNLKTIFASERTPGRMNKVTNDSRLDFLPPHLILDTTGNLEYILDPRTNYEDWVRQLQVIEDVIGPGSMQGTVSLTFRDLFGSNSAESIYGYLVLSSEIDMLQKLKKGYEKYIEKGSGQVARPLVHPFVGPMTRMRSDLLLRDLRAHAIGQGLSKQALTYVSGEDSSYKYMGATVYRPDILPGKRAIFEIRDAHSDTSVIRTRMARMIHYTETGFAPFLGAANIETFDQEAAFARFPKIVQETMPVLFPSTAKAGESYSREEIVVNEVFRAMSYPLRNWDSILALTGASAQAKSAVQRAQLEYQNNVHAAITQLNAKTIDVNKARELVQFAVTKFVADSELLTYLEKYEAEIFNQSKQSRRAS